ncbi:MAG: MFS transporter [Planctomycetes bacterium]|nr:MFS transporter [Planctomycetota bacterium]
MTEPQNPMLPADATDHVARNYAAHMIEGGLYLGGMALLSMDTVMPTIVKELGGPSWLISVVPVLMLIGFTAAPILLAHRIEGVRRFKPYCVVSGVFQRLPYLAAALVLLALGGTRQTLALALVVAAPLVSGFAGGLTLTAWQQLLIKTIPVRRRASMLAGRNIISCLLGVAAGGVVRVVLARWPGATGYGLLHLGAFATICLSYVVFLLVRERPHDPPKAAEPAANLLSSLRLVSPLLREERSVRLFLIAQALGCGLYIFVPFLAIQARLATGRGESYVGDLLLMQMVGAIVGNLLAAYQGDRWGPRWPMIIGRILFVLIAIAAAVASSNIAFRAIFFVYGFAFYIQNVGQMTMAMEIVPVRRRATVLGVMSLVNLPSMLVATGICAIVRSTSGSFTLTAAIAATAIVLSLAAVLRMSDPRKTPAR